MQLRNRRVLVTGGSGFIPSHLTRRLVSMGADVSITTKYRSVIDNVRLCDLWETIGVIELDLRNRDSLKQICDLRPDVIFHMAAYNHVGDSFTHVSEALASNALGTANLMESYDGYEKFIYMSSSEVYGLQDNVPFVEKRIPHPISPYAIGKHAGEEYCYMKMKSQGCPATVLRPFNTFGPYQSPRAIVAELILKCLKGVPIETTMGEQTREFNYVSNIVDALIVAAEKDDTIGHVLNIGAGNEIAIRDLVQLIHKETESISDVRIGALAYRPTEVWRMCSDAENAKQIMGWTPRVSFEEGVRRTITWFREYMNLYCSEKSSLQNLARMSGAI